MNTTITKHLLCLLLMMLYIGTTAQVNLAMNTGHFPDKESKTKSDTLQTLHVPKSHPSAVRQFKVSPNGTTAAIHVVAKNIEEGAYTFEIFTLSGERVHNEVSQLSRTHYKIIDTSTLPEGSYYLIIRSGKMTFKEKISM